MRQYSTRDTSPGKSVPWVLDSRNETEQVVLGTYFAAAVTAIAHGHKDKLKASKRPTRKLYYDDRAFNPYLESSSSQVGIEAFVKEREKYWNSKGGKLSKQPRDCQVGPTSNEDLGPKNPVEFPHVYESPVKSFGRSREIRPFSRVKRNLDKPNFPVLQEALVKRNLTINPMSYRMPDLWNSTTLQHESSVFRSTTNRLGYEKEQSQNFRESLERNRAHSLGRMASAPDSPHQERPHTTSVDELQMGERGMQSIEDAYFFASSQLGDGTSHVFNEVDPHIRRVPINQESQYLQRLLPRSADDSKRRDPSPISSNIFNREHSSSRPVSPSQEIIAHSRQRGFTFTVGGESHDNLNGEGFKVYIREQLPDGQYTIRQVAMEEYLDREESRRKQVESELHQQPILLPQQLSPTPSKRIGKASPIPKPLSFEASTSYITLPSRARTSIPSLSSKSSTRLASHENKSIHPSRNSSTAPIMLGIKNSRFGYNTNWTMGRQQEGGGVDSSSLIMDDSLFGDEDLDDESMDHINGRSKPHVEDISERKSTSKSYNKTILSRWTPPMCYSKKKAQDHFLFQRNHGVQEIASPPGSAPQAMFSNNLKLKHPGKTFEEADYHLAHKGQHSRSKSNFA